MKNCIIVGAGEFFESSLEVKEGDLVIAADGGLKHLQGLGVVPDLLVGDFDSLDIEALQGNGLRVVELPREKDDTDTGKAVKIALEKGCRTFHIYGCSGGRVDHTLANIQLLTHLSKRGAQGFLYSKGEIVTAITDGKMEFGEKTKGLVSVFSVDKTAEGVTVEGLKYPLTNHRLTNDFPLGVSNKFTGKKSVVSVESGTLAIVYERQRFPTQATDSDENADSAAQ